MPELGKIDREFFDEFVSPNLGAARDDVPLGPRHGVDFGVVDVGEKAVAMATDPIFLVPSLGFERAAWFAIHGLLADVATSGVPPSHLAVDFTLPPEITDAEFETVWETFDCEATDFGVAIVTGHTGRYAGCTYPMVGGGTTLAVGDSDRIVRPDGARVGDRVVVTNGPAIASTGLLAVQFGSLMREGIGSKAAGNGGGGLPDDGGMPEDAVDAAMDRFGDASAVKDALTAAAAGPVHAMQGARESGIYGGLSELARAADVGVEIDRDAVPVQPGVMEACEFFGIDPWISRSEGTLLAAVDPSGVDDVVAALDTEGIPAADVGNVTDGEGLVVDGHAVDHLDYDPFWGAFEEYMGVLQDDWCE